MSLDLPWSELVAVGVRTADGASGEDVSWQFLLAEGLVEVPGARIDAAAFAELEERLPGLDSEKVVRAMSSTRARTFRVWHHEDSRYAPAACHLGARFGALIGRLGGDPAAAPPVFDELRAAWGGADRHYHDVEHLIDCLRELDRAAAPAALADVVELALWYHDAIYEAGAADCEERSARLLAADAARLALPAGAAGHAAALVRATAHASAPPPAGDPAADLLLDIDLSILGRDPLRFLDFDHAVEEEYAAIPTEAFRRGRAAFLAGMLARPCIFRTEALRTRFEAAARRNLTALLASARYRR